MIKYYSQFHQDKILDEEIFIGKTNGFFIDVGAFRLFLSNTMFFEEHRKWDGICIEPHPNHAEELRGARKTNIEELAILNRTGVSNFTAIDGYADALSGISEFYDKQFVERVKSETKEEERRTIEVKVDTLQNVIDKYGVYDIDYCSIDVEGAELEVLKSIDFSKTNIHCFTIENQYDDPKIIRSFLLEKGYGLWKPNLFIEVESSFFEPAV